jgi:hypothetical protein
MPNKNYFSRAGSELGTGSTVYIKDSKCPPGVRLHYTNIVVCNETSNGSYATVGVIKADNFIAFTGVVALVAGLEQDFNTRGFVSSEGDELAVRIEDNTAGDDLSVSFIGYVEPES